jgi:hypothetical protein
VGDIPDTLAHPRDLLALDADLASATATRVREMLALDDAGGGDGIVAPSADASVDTSAGRPR